MHLLSKFCNGLFLAVLLCCSPQFSNAQDAVSADEAKIFNERKNILEVTAEDIVTGEANAPITIIEYASLSCGHCANFHNKILPEIKKAYIDTGKVRLVFRHFPLNAPALKASMVVECTDPAQRNSLLTVLFQTQEDWAFSGDFQSKLENIARVAGMEKETFDTCLNNKELENKILARQLDGKKVKVASTPSFFINGKKIRATDFKGFAEIIDPLIGNTTPELVEEKAEPAGIEGSKETLLEPVEPAILDTEKELKKPE